MAPSSTMVQWESVANAVLAMLPAAAIFFVAYGRYDGTFRDNVVFIYFIGGLIMGGFLGLFSLVALGSGIGDLVRVLLIALIYPIALVAGINRRKWQGDRHAIFNGGAFGLGCAVMLTFTVLYAIKAAITPFDILRNLLLSGGLAGIFFGMGLLAGDAVRLRRQLRVAFLGAAILFAPAVFLVGYVRDGALLWTALLLAYGAIFAVAAERRILIHGIAEDARRQRRRLARRES